MNIGPTLVSTAFLTFLTLYPFYLQKYKIRRYKGIWKTIGDLYGTPKRAIVFPLTWLIGNLVYILFVQ
jgi:hypothetical protein